MNRSGKSTRSFQSGFRSVFAALSPAKRRCALSGGELFSAEQELAYLRHAYDALQESERIARRRHGLLISRLGHELRTPLAPLMAVAGILKHCKSEVEVLASAGAVIERQVWYIGRIVDDLLVAIRSDCDTLGLILESVDLSSLVQETIAVMKPLFDNRHQELCISNTLDGRKLRLDRLRIMQVLVNLLENASRYTQDGGRIHISLRMIAPEVEIEVSDTGIGISESMLSTIFEAYSRENEAIAFHKDGMGIGLSVVHEIVKAHGGRVTASSMGRGHGSSFIVGLPLREIQNGPAGL